jgi:uncharacterized membrane protein YGL010W
MRGGSPRHHWSKAIVAAEQTGADLPRRQARNLAGWLAAYGESHTSQANKRLHWVCIPLIVLSLLGLLQALPVPAPLAQAAPGVDWSIIAAVMAAAYYLTLSASLAAGSLLVLGALLAGAHSLGGLPWPLWLSSVVIFVLAWIGQFIGHVIEGRRPSFFEDLQFLLIGPLWLLAAAYRRLGLPY